MAHGWESEAWEEGTGRIITMGTCSICGNYCPSQEMAINSNIMEVRCRDCFKKYGDVPLETLCAALCVYGIHIYDLSEDDLDILVPLQKKKITLNREFDKIQENANKQRAKINKTIDGTIKKIKENMETGY